MMSARGGLDIKGNTMEVNTMSKGINLLWKERSNLRQLNESCNAFTHQSFVHLFWKTGMPSLEMLDAVTMLQQEMRAPS